MINKIYRKICKIIRPNRVVQSAAVQSSWEQYKDYIKIHPTAIIAPSATIKIFNPPVPPCICFEVGEGSHIFSTFALLRPQTRITIGKRCQLGASQFISADSITVGDDVIMAWGCTVIDSDNHSVYWSDRRYDVERCRNDYVLTHGQDIGRSHDWSKVKIQQVSIQDKTWIGFNTIILKGVTIGEGAVIGAGSVVTSKIDPWHVGAGNPCKTIKRLPENAILNNEA